MSRLRNRFARTALVLGLTAFAAAAEEAEEVTSASAVIAVTPTSAHSASELLLGHNLEAGLDTVPGMLSDRLDNPKFLGPPHPVTGIAPGWRHNSDNMSEVRCELTPGAGMSGDTAQLIQNFSDKYAYGILQNKRQVRAGETLEVELWARAWNKPVTLKVGLLPLAARQPAYAEATIEVRAAHYVRYTATLTCPADDDEAAFYCAVQGQGAVWVDQIHLRPADEPLLCRELIDGIAELKIPVLRFPGGVVSTAYRWKHGTGRVEQRPVFHDPVCKTYMYYDFGTDEFLRLCKDQGTVPHITVNVGFGTPQEAADWARYCAVSYRKEGLEPPAAYFQIGNHPYLSAELAHMTPEMYVETLKAYVPAIREAYPGARIVAVSNPYDPVWRDTVLDGCAGLDLFDAVALQAYASQPPDMGGLEDTSALSQAREVRMAALSDAVAALGKTIGDTADACRQRELPARISFVEWNLWGHASHRDGHNFHEPYDMQHALFAGSMIHEFVRRAPDMESANFYHLVNPMGIFQHKSPEVVATCMVDLFKLYRPGLPGEMYPVEVSAPALGSRSAVDAVALRNGQGTWIYCVNFHPRTAVDATVRGLDLEGASVVTLAAPAPDAQPQRTGRRADGAAVALPPLSVTRIHIPASE